MTRALASAAPAAALAAALLGVPAARPLAAQAARPSGDSAAADSAAADSALASRVGYTRGVRPAVVLGSVVPGSGHYYAGEPLRGTAFFLVGVTHTAIGAWVFQATECETAIVWVSDCEDRVPAKNRVQGASILAVGVAAWMFSAVDAGRAVRRGRARHAARARRVALRPVVAPAPSGAGWRLGLAAAR